MGATAFAATLKWKATSGGSYAALTTVTDIDPGNSKLGTIKMKLPLANTARWRDKRAGDLEAGQMKVDCTWLKSEFEIIRDLQDDRTQAYWELTILEDGSKWEFIGHVSEINKPPFKTSDEGVEELLWSYTIEITGEPTYTPGV